MLAICGSYLSYPVNETTLNGNKKVSKVFGPCRLYAASQVQASSAPSGDLLGGLGRSSTPIPGSTSGTSSKGPFDAIIAIGVLIKGDTAHFEHIAESVSRGLMRLQLDFGVPVIFGLLVRNLKSGRYGCEYEFILIFMIKDRLERGSS